MCHPGIFAEGTEQKHENHAFLTSALVGGEWLASRLGRFIPGTHWVVGWVVFRTGLNDVEKIKYLTLPGLELRFLILATVLIYLRS
jgi:hypothetical protein